MKYSKKLAQFLLGATLNYSLYSAAIFFQFQPALKLLPFYLWLQVVFVFLSTIIILIAFAVDAAKDIKLGDYHGFQKTYGWLVTTEALASVLWSFAFASQAMYGIAIAIVLNEGLGYCLRSVLLALPEEAQN